jgi:seryl-tRNA synthetase
MLSIKFIRENVERVKSSIQAKQIDVDLDQLLELDARRRKLTSDINQLREQRNKLSMSIPTLQGQEKQSAITESKQVGEKLKAYDEESNQVQADFDRLMLLVPNVTAPEVPFGTSEDDNKEVSRWGQPTEFDFKPKDHIELATSLGLVNFDRVHDFAGSRSYALMGGGVLLELAVLRYALDHVVSKGFTPVAPPVMVREEAMVGTGFFPLGREDTYQLKNDDLYLVGTSEVSLVSLHRDEILNRNDLPIHYAGISPCFRREAGSHGRDTKGFYRVHQFQKVEQVTFCEADEQLSEREHYLLLQNSEEILQGLRLPYRVALACSGELGLGQVRKHEIESWMPSRNKYSETHSCSTLHDFQARRSGIRYRDDSGKARFVHTLNNTAIASPRILIAILENYQNEDGSVTIPEVLRPYMGNQSRLELKK